METNNDVTERKRADAELRESERRYRNIFQTAGISIWEEDFSQVQSALDDLKARAVRDFAQYFTVHSEFVRQAITMVRVVDVKRLLHHQIQRNANGIIDLLIDHRGAWGANIAVAQRWAGRDLYVRPSVRTRGGVMIALPSPRCQGVLSEGWLVLVDRAAAWTRGDCHVWSRRWRRSPGG